MPKITVRRVFVSIILLWLWPLILYCALPSPTTLWQARDDYVQDTLSSGARLATVINQEGVYGLAREGFGSSAGGLYVPWQLTTNLTSTAIAVVLVVGSAKFDLTEAVRQGKKYQSDPVEATFECGTGTDDKVIAMPWFPWGDATLFESRPLGFSNLGLKVRIGDPGTVEIWADPSIRNQYAVDNGYDAIWPGGDREHALLASFSNIPEHCSATTCISQVRTRFLRGHLLSKTFEFRRWLLRNFETQIFINLYIMYPLISPREFLGYHILFIIPIALEYLLLGYCIFRQVRHLQWTIRRQSSSDDKGMDV